MTNKEIIRLLKFTASLLELNNANEFKIKSYSNAIFHLEKLDHQIGTHTLQELEQMPGIGKSIAGKITEIILNNSFAELQNLIEIIPNGVIQMLDIKGIGPKKVKIIWRDLNIETLEDLLVACKEGKIAHLKGFGESIQSEIIEYLEFKELSKGKMLYAKVENIAMQLKSELIDLLRTDQIEIVGEVRRKIEIISVLQILISHPNPQDIFVALQDFLPLIKNEQLSSPYVWRGNVADVDVLVEIKIYPEADFVKQIYIHSCHTNHLATIIENNKTIGNIVNSQLFATELQIFQSLNLPFIEPELREGVFEIEMAKNNKVPSLITDNDLKGALHNHSTYSDGANTLEEMAVYCKELGYQYLGISDHSKTATYARGLKEDQIIAQHLEIDKLNLQLAPFKIFKGTESDILGDGSLDYSPEVLQTFDFVVASIHGNLKMDIEKATQRLITAIENPFTTILGHPTGRLLLKRKGYPIDYKKIIEACAANNVIMEINANPNRLDLDWRWIHYAIDKGVMLSINPDAHELSGYHTMHYGVCVGRKGGLEANNCFNSQNLEFVTSYFKNRKAKINTI